VGIREVKCHMLLADDAIARRRLLVEFCATIKKTPVTG
jgi:hypothetical protein